MDDISKLVLALLSSGVVAAVITGVFQRRKLGADATEVITKAAASMVDTMQNRMDDQEAEITQLKAKVRTQDIRIGQLIDKNREHEAFRISTERAASRHQRWDQEIVEVVRALDPEAKIDDPPPVIGER